MIDELHVRDVALIRDAAIEPSAGLTVLTGETGAGKTALLSSIKLLVGERADAGMVREGAASLEVEGRLFLRGDDEDGTVVRRRVGADGRGRVELNGHMASVRELAERVGATVDLCGQHEHQRLLAVATHAEMLDTWAGAPAAEALDAYRDALDAAGEAAAELERVREMGRATGERLDEAAFVLRRIDEVDPREGELEELEAQLPRVEHGEVLMSAALGARERLSADDGACDALGEAVRSLREAARFDEKLGGWAATLESALLDIEDVASELRGYADEVDFDPEELDRVQARLAALEGLRRAYGPRMADVLRRREEAREVTPESPFVMPEAMLVTALLTAVVARVMTLGEYATEVSAPFHPLAKPLTAARAGPVRALVSFESDDAEVDVALLTSASALAWADFAAVRRSVAAR